jgi:hypothetical protein
MGLRVRDDFEDKTARIRDVELGARLGYARPRAIRELIERMLADGKLSDAGLCRIVVQSGGRPANEFWLNERSAIKVIAKSETPVADAILDEVIDVFVAWRNGKLMPRLLADQMCEWDEMWPTSTVAALCRLYGQPYVAGGRQPKFLASVFRKLYCLVLDEKTYAEMKARNEEPHHGSNHHQLLNEQARKKFRGELEQIEVTAMWCDSRADFWARLERVYLKHPLQLRLMGLQLPANDNTTKTRARRAS